MLGVQESDMAVFLIFLGVAIALGGISLAEAARRVQRRQKEQTFSRSASPNEKAKAALPPGGLYEHKR
jgi:hypothetical protein